MLVLDLSKTYFHGSSGPKLKKLDEPTCRHPFYVTSDLHYAMAFCTKSHSQTGEYEKEEKTFNLNPDDNFVYIVKIKPNINVFKFKANELNIFSKELLEWITKINQNTFDFDDIYEFCNAIQLFMHKAISRSNANYLKYITSNEHKYLMPKNVYLEACSFLKENNLFGDYTQYDTHEVMEPILKKLKNENYNAVLTKETDYIFQNYKKPIKVTTKNSIAIFNSECLDLNNITPIPFKKLKKLIKNI